MFMKYTCDTILHIFWSRTWTWREDVRSICIWAGPTRRAVHWNQSGIKAHSAPSTKILLLSFFKCIQAEALIQCALKITPLSVHLHYNFFLCNSKINCSCTAPIAPPSIPSCLTWTKIFWPPPSLISTSSAMFSSYILFVMTETKRQINFRKRNWKTQKNEGWTSGSVNLTAVSKMINGQSGLCYVFPGYCFRKAHLFSSKTKTPNFDRKRGLRVLGLLFSCQILLQAFIEKELWTK